MSNTLLAKQTTGGSNVLYLKSETANGFVFNGKDILLPETSGTLALKADCLTDVGDGLQSTDNKVSAKVKTGEKVISVSSDGFATTLGLKWDKTAKKIGLIGIDDSVVSEIDATDFVKDGMLDTVQLSSEGALNYMVFTWNTDAGKKVLPVDVTKFSDVYTASDGVKLADSNFSIDWTKVAALSLLGDYLKTADASATYLTKTDAESTYQTKTAASAFESKVASTYATTGFLDSFKNEVASTYETSAHAASTYETTAHVVSTYATTASLNNYLTTSAASATYATIATLTGDYLTKTDAESTYAKASDFSDFKTTVGNTYLSKTDASTTYATKEEHNAVAKALSAENITWSDVTLEKVYDLVKTMAQILGAKITG